MKHRSVTRVVAATALTCLLFAFAMPTLAAPGGAADSWSPASIVQWLQSLWTGWFDLGDDHGEPEGIGNVHGALDRNLDPNGATSTGTAPGEGEDSFAWDGDTATSG